MSNVQQVARTFIKQNTRAAPPSPCSSTSTLRSAHSESTSQGNFWDLQTKLELRTFCARLEGTRNLQTPSTHNPLRIPGYICCLQFYNDVTVRGEAGAICQNWSQYQEVLDNFVTRSEQGRYQVAVHSSKLTVCGSWPWCAAPHCRWWTSRPSCPRCPWRSPRTSPSSPASATTISHSTRWGHRTTW